jgi:hypothetical protein
MTNALRLYNIRKNDIKRFTTRCCEKLDDTDGYVKHVTCILDDFLSKYTYKFSSMEVFGRYMEIAVLAAIWIINKFIEDDHLYINDITQLIDRHVNTYNIIYVESEIFYLCQNIRKYIT